MGHLLRTIRENSPEFRRPMHFQLLQRSFTLVVVAMTLSGCSTLRKLPPPDLGASGWRVYQGQAVWHPPRGDIEIAGDLVVARKENEGFVEFIKTPFPIVNGWRTLENWQVEFPPQNRVFNGREEPSHRFIWPFLPACLIEGRSPPAGWVLTRTEPGRWRFENKRSGEYLEGFLNP